MSKSLSFNPLWLMLLAGMAWLWVGSTTPHLQPNSVTSNSWVNLGLEGGKVNALVFDPTDANIVYAGTYGGGVFKSEDAGQTWSAANTGPINTFTTWVNTLAIHPFTPTILYLGGYLSGVYQSLDSGASWDGVYIINDVYKANTTHFAINPSDPTVLYASTFSGVIKSVSGGSQWSPSGLSGSFLRDVVIHPVTPTTVFAIDHGKVYQTLNSGTSWQVLTQVVSLNYPPWLSPITVFDLDIDPLTPSTLYLGTSQGVFKSVDTGATWQTTALTNTLVQVVKAHPLTPTLVYAGTSTGVWASADGGANWNAIGARNLNVQVLEIQPTRPDILWLGTNGQGVIKLQDGLVSPANTGLYGVQVMDLAIDPVISSTYYVGAGYGAGVFQSLDHGQTWSRVSDGLPNGGMVWAVAVDPLTPTTLYAGTNDGLFRSLNGGQSWLTTTIGPTQRVWDITLHPITSSIGYATVEHEGLYRTEDSGISWQKIITVSSGFENLYIHPLSPTVLYAADSYGSGLRRSMDGGMSWTSITAGLPADFENRGLVVDPLEPLTLFAATSTYYTFTGVFKSVNGGASWEAFNTGLAAYPARGLALSPDATTLYLLTSGEVYASSLLSPQWQPIGVGVPDYDARSLTVASYPLRRLLALTEGGLLATEFGELPTVTPTSSPTITPTPTASSTSTTTPSPTITAPPTNSPTASPSPTVTPTPSPTVTVTVTPTATPTNSPTASPSPTVTPSATVTSEPPLRYWVFLPICAK